MTLTTTLNNIHKTSLSAVSWGILLDSLGKSKADNEPLEYKTIADVIGIEDALWCCCAESKYAKYGVIFKGWCAKQVQHLMTDGKITKALDITTNYALGKASKEELDNVALWTPRGIAWAASWVADVAAAKVDTFEEKDIAWSDAWNVANDAQKEMFLKMCDNPESIINELAKLK